MWLASRCASSSSISFNSSITYKSPLSDLFVTAFTASRKSGKRFPSLILTPVKNVRISIARLSASFLFCMITYGSSIPLLTSSLVRLIMLISSESSGSISFHFPRSDFGSRISALAPCKTSW